MLCNRFFNSATLCSPSIISDTNNKFSSLKGSRHHQIAHSSHYPTPTPTTCSIKSEVLMDSKPQTHEPSFQFLSKKPYTPPSWAANLNPVPSHIFSLGHFPTPIHKWNLPNLPKGTEVYLKRDDLSGMQLSGNKVRKLEFLMAEAVAQGADCIITIGGIQSNHCRATAVAAKYLNLDCYLILRTSKALVDKDPGLTGNLLVERLVGAHVDLVSKEEYASVGSVALTNILKEKLLSEGRKPYVIPVGGSNSLGTWGYVEAVREIQQQLGKGNGEIAFDDIIVACGSGGTIAGLSVGNLLSGLAAKVHAYSVCDDPDYFFDYVQGLIDGLQAGVSSRDIVNIHNAKGLGYAMNTTEELNFVQEIAKATGVVLDPVYSGKAAYGMMRDMVENPGKWEGRKVIFIHTGGLLGLYEKTEQIVPLVGNWHRMDINESVPRKEGTGRSLTSRLHGQHISNPRLLMCSLSDIFQLRFTSGTFLIFPRTPRFMSRDDLSGMQLSGNKVRKLEFLMAEAATEGADCIITIGGVQSNHCRATAVAAKYLNLDCYLILRTTKDLVDKDPGLSGNLLVERLAGARIELVSEEDYARVGRVELTNILKEKLLSEGRKPYVIPMGGSTSLATWGYIEAVREIQQELKIGNNNVGATFDDIVVACGSGCTGAGLALGSRLSGLGAEVRAYSAWGEPDYFYEYAQGLLDGLQAGLNSYDILDIKDAKGLGYAINTEDELIFLKEIAEETGIILDPVYSGKAAYRMMRDMADDPARWEGRKVLFIHTGGLLSLFDKADAVAPLVGNWRKMDIHG